jgi:HEAT repeat protein
MMRSLFKTKHIVIVCGLISISGFLWFAFGGSGPATLSEKVKTAPIRMALKLLFKGLELAGAKSSAEAVMDAALKTKDRSEIAQAMVALVYKHPWTREAVITVLRGLLTNNDPEIRLGAARNLYTIGDTSARPALIEIMRTKDPIWLVTPMSDTGKLDLRLSAAGIAAQFRDRETSAAMLDLYHRSKAQSLLGNLVKLGVAEALPMIKGLSRNRPTVYLMEDCGKLRSQSEAAYVSGVWADESRDMATRLAAAWAMTQMQFDERPAQFIRNFVANEVEKKSTDYQLGNSAVKYLGTLPDAESIELLEDIVRQSTKSNLVQVAVVNLMLNHTARSDIAAQMVIDEFSGKRTKLGFELAMQLASISSDPKIIQAGEAYDVRYQEKLWKKQGVGRAQWSVWGWATDYVITINRR